MDTKSNILRKALELFNTTNTQASTTNHIAKAMQISPGNLHYHYKNREEIIRELYKQMKVKYTLQPSEFPNTLAELLDANKKSFNIQWEYRFFYTELLFLLSRDPQLKKEYMKDAIAKKDRYRVIFKQLQNKQVLSFSTESDIDYLVDMILLIEQFWISYIKISSSKQPDINIAIKQIEKIIEPFESQL